MGWSDRRYDEDDRVDGNTRLDGVFWLIGILIGAHLLRIILEGTGAVQPGEFDYWFGVSRSTLGHGYLWQLVTFQAIHISGWDLLFSMLWIFFGGRILESLGGTKKLFTAFLLGGLVAGLATLTPWVPAGMTVGSSAGRMSIMVVLLFLAPELLVNLFFFVVRLKWLVMALVAIEVLSLVGGSGASRGGTSSFWWTSFGGVAAGAAYAWVWPRLLGPQLGDFRARAARRREVARLEQELDEERELDRILAKINQEGMDAITGDERRFLQRRSGKYSRRP